MQFLDLRLDGLNIFGVLQRARPVLPYTVFKRLVFLGGDNEFKCLFLDCLHCAVGQTVCLGWDDMLGYVGVCRVWMLAIPTMLVDSRSNFLVYDFLCRNFLFLQGGVVILKVYVSRNVDNQVLQVFWNVVHLCLVLFMVRPTSMIISSL